jgi:hypothetical protein
MSLEHLNELVKEVHDLQEAARGSEQPHKLRALASLAIELTRAVQDIHDRLLKLEGQPPQSN